MNLTEQQATEQQAKDQMALQMQGAHLVDSITYEIHAIIPAIRDTITPSQYRFCAWLDLAKPFLQRLQELQRIAIAAEQQGTDLSSGVCAAIDQCLGSLCNLALGVTIGPGAAPLAELTSQMSNEARDKIQDQLIEFGVQLERFATSIQERKPRFRDQAVRGVTAIWNKIPDQTGEVPA